MKEEAAAGRERATEICCCCPAALLPCPWQVTHAKNFALRRRDTCSHLHPPISSMRWGHRSKASRHHSLASPPKNIPPPSSTKAFPGQPPFLSLLSHSSHLLKEPRENSVSSGGPWMSWQRHQHIRRQWLFPTPPWGPLWSVSSVLGIVSTVSGTHILTRELQHQFLRMSRLKTDHLYAMHLLC